MKKYKKFLCRICKEEFIPVLDHDCNNLYDQESNCDCIFPDNWDVCIQCHSYQSINEHGSFLVPGNIIAMWDGKYWGVYPCLKSALKNAKARIEEPGSIFQIPDDYECFEFLEVLNEDPGCHFSFKDGFQVNENGTRVSFGYPVKNHGNKIDILMRVKCKKVEKPKKSFFKRLKKAMLGKYDD